MPSISFIDSELIRKYDALPRPSLDRYLRLISLPCTVPSLHDRPLFRDPSSMRRTQRYLRWHHWVDPDLRESYHASE